MAICEYLLTNSHWQMSIVKIAPRFAPFEWMNLAHVCSYWLSCWFDLMQTKEPVLLCRKAMFGNKTGLCNRERKDKCEPRKDEWFNCVTKEAKTHRTSLKPPYINNSTAIERLPLEKLASLFSLFTFYSQYIFSQRIALLSKCSG